MPTDCPPFKNEDSIVVMGKGKIVAQGTHQELMKSKKEYKKLVEMQTVAHRHALFPYLFRVLVPK